MSLPVPVTSMANISNTSFVMGEVSGEMGLAFEGLAAPGTTPFLQALARENKLASPLMSFMFTRINKTSPLAEEPAGTFTLGGTNQNLYSGEIEYLPLISADAPRYWSLGLTSAPAIRPGLISSAE
jgi:cathepsin D